MEYLLPVLDALFKGGVLGPIPLALLIICILLYGFKVFIKPTFVKVNELASISSLNSSFAELEEKDIKKFQSIMDSLDDVTDKLSKLNDAERETSRGTEEIRQDIDQIKQILVQFQGHLLYSAARHSDGFGNKELR